MNEKAITKHMLNQYRVFVQREGDHYWITEGYCMWKLPLDTKAFDNRTAYPRLPDDGETLGYWAAKNNIRQGVEDLGERKAPDLAQVRPAYDPDTDALTLSQLVYLTDDGDLRVFTSHDHRYVLVNQDFMHMLGNENTYLYYQSNEDGPIAVETPSGELVAVIMPMYAPTYAPVLADHLRILTRKADDLDTEGEDHAADMLRYFAVMAANREEEVTA